MSSRAKALMVVAPWLVGCGAMINGLHTDVQLERATEDVVYVLDGVRVPQASSSVTVSNDEPHTLTALSASGSAHLELRRKVSWAAVLLDVLCSATILGVAAPISDGLLDTWSHLVPQKVRLVPERRTPPWADLSFTPESPGTPPRSLTTTEKQREGEGS